ncbi:MAG: hypothetical protein ABL958_17080, partial [Bdellovibrionia bacterium]
REEENEIIWTYWGKKRSEKWLMFNLTFDKKTKKLANKFWYVADNEPWANLELAKQRFPNAQFEKVLPKWCNPHSYPDEEYFVEPELGVYITYLRATKRVESISWSQPNPRAVASLQNEPCPARKYEF